MALPTKPKKEPRPIAVTIRVSSSTVQALKELAKEHNLSQADVIEYLIQAERREKEEALKKKK